MGPAKLAAVLARAQAVAKSVPALRHCRAAVIASIAWTRPGVMPTKTALAAVFTWSNGA